MVDGWMDGWMDDVVGYRMMLYVIVRRCSPHQRQAAG
jgi:hypothetical protein